jgi:hypothetical protein
MSLPITAGVALLGDDVERDDVLGQVDRGMGREQDHRDGAKPRVGRVRLRPWRAYFAVQIVLPSSP